MFDRKAKLAFIVASVALAASAAAFNIAIAQLNIFLKKEAVEVREPLANIPRVLGDWTALGDDIVYGEASIEELGTSTYLTRQYQHRDGGEDATVGVHVAYYTGMIDTIPHIPDRCLVAGGYTAETVPAEHSLEVDRSGWRFDPAVTDREGDPVPILVHRHSILGTPQSLHLPVGDFEVRTTAFQHHDMPGARLYAGYFFIANGRLTASPEGVKRLAFRPSERYAYYCKVQFTMLLPRRMGIDVYVDRVTDLLDVLLPELMRCLPDWVEVERRADEATVPATT